MSIINEALKKAQRDKRGVPLSQANLLSGFDAEFPKKKRGINWGPIFVLSVLLLIAGPILMPVFSTPAKRFVPTAASEARPKPEASLGSVGNTDTRQAQFQIEQVAAAPAVNPLSDSARVSQTPYLALSGIVISEGEAYCIINDRVAKPGDNVFGATLLRVTEREAVLDSGGQEITLRLAQG